MRTQKVSPVRTDKEWHRRTQTATQGLIARHCCAVCLSLTMCAGAGAAAAAAATAAAAHAMPGGAAAAAAAGAPP